MVEAAWLTNLGGLDIERERDVRKERQQRKRGFETSLPPSPLPSLPPSFDPYLRTISKRRHHY